MYSINERVRFLLKELGKSQEAFAKGIYRSRSEISNIVYDKVVVKEEIIIAICNAYSVNRIWLETGVGEPFQPKDKREELKAVFADVLSGRQSEKNAFIEAVAQLPDDVFPVLVKSWIAAAEEMKQRIKEKE
jgi:transcriptional regulator with XRE-family HTH domain